MDYNTEQFYRQDFSPEQLLLGSIRACLSDPVRELIIPDNLHFSFNPAVSNIYITLFQRGTAHIRWGSRRKTLKASLQRDLQKLREHPRFSDFAVDDQGLCRIMLEVVTEEYPCILEELTTVRLDDNRLEPGIHGMRFTHNGQVYYFMPTDAVTHNLMTVRQIFNFLARRTGVAGKTNSISERMRLMRTEISDCRLIRSFAVISHEDKALPLYRGYPVPVACERDFLRESALESTDWVLDNMKPNGQFLYYYDGVRDTEVDFQHPRMTNPTYYNILRHSGGTITLLRAYELTGDARYLEGARRSIDFFVTVTREHEYQGNYACYPFFNKKSKLGGAGIGLVALIHYYLHSGDNRYRKYIDGLVQHILSRVSGTGEMIGYFIHPSCNDGKEIIDPDEETKRQLFSFYYPGEALLGLALYLLHIPDIAPELRSLILDKSKQAMDFLIYERPRKYRHMFTPLPADGWLMQAIEEWVRIEGFTDQAYIDFVYNDAQAMIDHMYQEHDSPFFDYTGAFYYQYGEHAYPDGARCEGLMAAYYLALHLGDESQAEYFMKHIVKAAKNLAYTYNTQQSVYAHKFPEKSISSFRFKLTRQWVRVDSVQHAACFYARLYPVYPDQQQHVLHEPSTENQDHMYADANKIAEITGGRWFHLPGNRTFHGIRVNIERIEQEDICFTTTPEQWGKNIPETQSQLQEIFASGAAAAVISEEKYAADAPGPVLLVKNTRLALEKTALFCRDSLQRVKRVLITGTEGKTGFKFQLHYLLNRQTRAHATLDSSNLTVPILCSLGSMRPNDQVEILEASVAQPDVGIIRSTLAKPHLCVITEVGHEHVKTHGSFENLIRNKASIVEGLVENGPCIINADSKNYHVLREAIYRRKYVPVLTFGSRKKCDALLKNAVFDPATLTWAVEATIRGKDVRYILPILGEHAPLSSVSVLLAVDHLGYDVQQAGADYEQFKPYETMGKLSRIAYREGYFTFYDHSHRGSPLSFNSALNDLVRLSPDKGGRKIAVVGHMMNLGDQTVQEHEKLAGLIENAGVERLYTVGENMLSTHRRLKEPSILIKHADNYRDLRQDLFDDLRPGDLLFMKGHHRIWLKYLAEEVYRLGKIDEIR